MTQTLKPFDTQCLKCTSFQMIEWDKTMWTIATRLIKNHFHETHQLKIGVYYYNVLFKMEEKKSFQWEWIVVLCSPNKQTNKNNKIFNYEVYRSRRDLDSIYQRKKNMRTEKNENQDEPFMWYNHNKRRTICFHQQKKLV